MSAQAGLGISVSSRLAHCATNWILLRISAGLLKLRLQEWSLCILQVYATNAEAHYHPFLDEIGVAFQKVTSAVLIVLLGDFNAHVGTDNRHGRVLLEDKKTLILTETEGACYSSVPPMDYA